MTKPLDRCFATLFFVAGVVAMAIAPSGAAVAQDDVQKIAAVVNDEIISDYDVDQRLGLIIATTGEVDSPEEYQKMRDNVLELLIDEKLQIQEARELEISIPDEAIQQRYAEIAARNNITPQQFDASLEQMGADKSVVIEQLYASYAWEEVIAARLRPLLSIPEAEVNAYLDRMEENKGQPEYLLGEIFLAVDRPQDRPEVRRTAERLVSQIRDGAPFPNVARQFSEVATAATGGDTGWVMEDQLGRELKEVVPNMRRGQISEPIETPGGFYIVALRDKRKVMGASPDQITVDLSQIVLPIEGGDPQKAMSRASKRIRNVSRGCRDLKATARTLGSDQFSSLGEIKLSDLPGPLQQVIFPVETGQLSDPVVMGEELRIFLVCGRDEPESELPTYDQVENFLSNQKLSMMARRYLRDLRRDAIIDYR